jgi:nucleotide-binding universal stress UspA family protein
MKKRRVLIPLDGSEFSRQILPVVCAQFKPEETALILLRVALPMIAPSEAMAGAREALRSRVALSGAYDLYTREVDQGYAWSVQEQEAYRLQIREDLRAQGQPLEQAGYTVSTEVLFGEPAQSIIEYVRANPLDLIAMTTHGRTGFGRFVLGSVAESVLRGVRVPVLMVHTAEPPVEKLTARDELLQSLVGAGQLKLVVATDGSTFGKQALLAAGTLAQQLHARLTVLVTVSERDRAEHNQQIMGEVVNLVAGWPSRPELTPLVGYTDETVIEYVTKYPAHLLVLGAFRDRGAGASQAIGVTAQRIVQAVPVSTLVLKTRDLKLRHILVCADLDDDTVVCFASKFAHRVGAQLDLLHIVETNEVASLTAEAILAGESSVKHAPLPTTLRQRLVELKAEGYGPTNVHLQHGPVEDTILAISQKGHYDLIIVGSRATPGHFLHTMANYVVSFAKQSVLIVRT